MTMIEDRIISFLSEDLRRRYEAGTLNESEIRGHLKKVLSELYSFLPTPNGKLLIPGINAIEMTTGNVMYGEIRGLYTSIESLNRREKRSALSTRLLLQYFEPIFDTIYKWGGDFVSFEGEVFVAYFPGNIRETALLCAASAREICQNYPDKQRVKTDAGEIEIEVCLGFSSGASHIVTAGTSEQQYQFLFGEPTKLACAAARLSKSGAIVVDAETAKLVEHELDCTRINKNYFHISGINVIDPPTMLNTTDESTYIGDLIHQINRVKPYVPPELLSNIIHSQVKDMDSQYSQTVVLSLYISALEKQHLLNGEGLFDYVKNTVRSIISLLPEFRGTINRCYAYKAGYIIKVKYAHRGNFAIRAAADMANRFRENARQFGQKYIPPVYITIGKAFTVTLSGHRRSMIYAPGPNWKVNSEVLSSLRNGGFITDFRTGQALRKTYSLLGLELPNPIDRTKTVKAYELRKNDDDGSTRSSTELFGRGKEEFQLERALIGLREGIPANVVVEGETGTGKTVLVENALSKFSDFTVLKTSCNISREGSALYDVKHILNQLLFSGVESKTEKHSKLNRFCNALGDRYIIERISILAHFLEVDSPDARFVDLPPNLRRHNLFLTIFALFERLAKTRSLVIIFDDLQNVSKTSLHFILELIKRQNVSILVILISRPTTKIRLENICKNETDTYIRLSSLPNDTANSFIQELFGVIEPPKQFVDRVIDISGGNPFYIKEIMSVLRERSRQDTDVPDYDFDSVRLPTSIESALLNRLERLSATSFGLLKNMSVINSAVSVDALERITGDSRSEIELTLRELEDIRLLKREPGVVDCFALTSPLLAEVCYNMLLDSQRESLHKTVADVLQDFGTPPDILGEHYEKADVFASAITYYAIAAKNSVSGFNPGEGFVFIEKSIACLQRHFKDYGAYSAGAEIIEQLAITLSELIPYSSSYDVGERLGWQLLNLSDKFVTGTPMSYCYLVIAKCQLANGQSINARRSLEKLIDIAAEKPSRQIFVAGLAEYAMLLKSVGDRGAAQEYLHSAGKLAVRNKVNRDLFYQIAEALSEIANENEDEEAYKKYQTFALRIATTMGDHPYHIRALEEKGLILSRELEFDRAQGLFRRTIQMRHKIGYDDDFTAVYLELGKTLLLLGDIDSATRNFESAQQMLKQSPDSSQTSTVYLWSGKVELQRGYLDKALNLFSAAADAAVVADNERFFLLAQKNALMVQLELIGDFEAGRQIVETTTGYCNALHPTKKKQSDTLIQMNDIINLYEQPDNRDAILHQRLKNPGEGVQFFEPLTELITQYLLLGGNKYDIPRKTVMVWMKLGENIASSRGLSFLTGQYYERLGTVCFANELFERAMKNYEQAMNTYIRCKSLDAELRTRHLMRLLLLQMGETEKAEVARGNLEKLANNIGLHLGDENTLEKFLYHWGEYTGFYEE